MAGIDARTGRPLSGWPHVAQSISKCVTTELGTRVMRRDFGADIKDLQDAPLNEETIVDWIMAVAEALEPRQVGNSIYGEPRFRLMTVRPAHADEAGRLEIVIAGVHYPKGHLGDFTPAGLEELQVGAIVMDVA